MAETQHDVAAPRCGDHVFHHPSGETWVVAYVDGDRLAWCGWPFGEADLADCEIVERRTDAEHLEWLQKVSKVDDKRGRMARSALEAIVTGATPHA